MVNGPGSTLAATKTDESATFFDSQANSRQVGSETFLSQYGDWEKRRDQGVQPRWRGPLAGDGPHRAELVEAAKVFAGRSYEDLKPQQLLIADALNAPGMSRLVIEAPRRASKTASILYSILGRCLRQPRTLVTFAAQSGKDGSEAFDQWMIELEQALPPEHLYDVFESRSRGYERKTPRASKSAVFGARPLFDLGDSAPVEDEGPTRAGFRVHKRAGGEKIIFDNGSVFRVLKPEPAAFRGKAGDIIWLDEMQELPADEGAALLAGIIPLMDTRPGARVIVSGTAGETQAGVLWDYLKRLRADDPKMGGADWAADPLTPWADLQNIDTAMQLLEGVHPGIGTLTTTETMRDNYVDIPLPKWAREYLSLWPETTGDLAIPMDQWTAAMLASRPRKPSKVALGLSIAPGGTTAALAAAWRTSTGHAHIELIDYRSGTKWLPEEVPGLLSRLKSSLGVDMTPEAMATVTELNRAKRRPSIVPMNWSAMNAACVQFMRDLERGTLRQQDQKDLNHAVASATRREVRGQTQAWLFGSVPGEDIAPLVAGVTALRNWDTNYARTRSSRSIVTSTEAAA